MGNDQPLPEEVVGEGVGAPYRGVESQAVPTRQRSSRRDAWLATLVLIEYTTLGSVSLEEKREHAIASYGSFNSAGSSVAGPFGSAASSSRRFHGFRILLQPERALLRR